ncbi:MAG: DUF4340 domain-containing protein [Planctomycetota bacterium]
MGLRSTLVLLLLVGALGLGLWWTQGDPHDQPSPTQPVLGGRRLADAERLVIRNQKDAQPVVIARGPGYRFDVVEPVTDLASVARLQAMSSVWDVAQLIRVYAPKDIDADLLAQLGLDRPRGELRLTAAGQEQRVEIGDDGALGDSIWIRLNGGEVYQGPADLYSAIQGTVDDFREPLVFLNSVDSLRELRVVRHLDGGAQDTLALRHLPNGGYRLTEPVAARARPDVAASLAASILGLRVHRFASGNLGPRPDPDFEITVQGAAGAESVQLWRQGTGALVGVQQPRELAFSLKLPELTRLLEVPSRELRSRVLNPHAPDELSRIELDPGPGRGAPAVLQRGNDQLFALVQPVTSDANPTAVAELLRGLTTLTADEFVTEAATPEELVAFGLEPPELVLGVVGHIGRSTVQVHLGRDDGEHTFARRADEPFVVKVPKSSTERLRVAWPSLVSHRVWNTSFAARVAVVEQRRGIDGATFERDHDGVWRRRGTPDEVEGFGEMVGLLDGLRGEEVRDAAWLDAQPPALEVQLRAASEQKLERFQVYATQDGTWLRPGSRRVVFRLQQRDARDLLAEW